MENPKCSTAKNTHNYESMKEYESATYKHNFLNNTNISLVYQMLLIYNFHSNDTNANYKQRTELALVAN